MGGGAVVVIIIIVIVITAISRRIQKIQNEKIKSRTHYKRLFLYHLFYFIFMPIEMRGYWIFHRTSTSD